MDGFSHKWKLALFLTGLNQLSAAFVSDFDRIPCRTTSNRGRLFDNLPMIYWEAEEYINRKGWLWWSSDVSGWGWEWWVWRSLSPLAPPITWNNNTDRSHTGRSQLPLGSTGDAVTILFIVFYILWSLSSCLSLHTQHDALYILSTTNNTLYNINEYML